MWRRLRNFAACLIFALSVSPAYADDTVISNVAGTHFGGDGNEGAVGLTWQHTLDRGGLLFGLNGSEFPVGSLTEVDVDAYAVSSARLSLTGGVSIGEAAGTTQSNTLYKARIYLDSPLGAAWLVHAGYQYIDLDVIHGNLLTASVEFRPIAVWGIKAGAGYDAHGSFLDRHGTVEINWYGPQRLFAGVVLGRTGYDPAALGQISVEERLAQIYLGASVPVALGVLTLGVDTLSLEGASRQTVRIGLVQPIRP